MPVPTANISGDINAAIGEVSTLRVTAVYSDPVWADETNNAVIVGGGLIPVTADGLIDVNLPQTNDTVRVAINLEYVDNATRQRKSVTSGWQELTADVDLAELMATTPTSVPASTAEALAARIDGYTDHGDVSGVLTIDPATGTHVLNATGSLLVTLDTAPDGRIVTLYIVGGAENVTVDGITDLELTDGAFASFVRIRGAWVLASAGASGGTPATPDTTPPTAVTGLDATGGSGQVSATWAAATDAESSVSYRWRVWLTSGGATGTWTTTTSTSFTKTGLTVAGGYTVEVYAYTAGGASATATDTATVTVNPFPTADAYDTFTRSGSLWGSTTEGGALTWGSTGVTGLIGGTANPAIVANKSTDGGATVDIGRTTATVECDYVLNTGRASLMLGGANDGSSSVMARVFSAGELKVYHPGGGGTQIGSTVTGIAMTGHFTLSYDATTGAIEVKIDGVVKFTGTHAGLTGTRSGIETNNDATIDNVVWTWA